jgi:hypothetical protein
MKPYVDILKQILFEIDILGLFTDSTQSILQRVM